MVIQGWDVGFVGMQVGEKCKLIIFFNFVYGECGIFGVIFKNVIFIFEIEFVKIR